MNVRCFNNEDFDTALTIHKIYAVLEEKNDLYLIEDNTGEQYWYHKERFIIVRNV